MNFSSSPITPTPDDFETFSPTKSVSYLPSERLKKKHHNHIGMECSVQILRTLLWLFIYVCVSNGTYAAEPLMPPSSCKYPDPVEFAAVTPRSSSTTGGRYLNGSKAEVDCYSNFRVKSGDRWLTCVNGQWQGAGGRPVECGKKAIYFHSMLNLIYYQFRYSLNSFNPDSWCSVRDIKFCFFLSNSNMMVCCYVVSFPNPNPHG